MFAHSAGVDKHTNIYIYIYLYLNKIMSNINNVCVVTTCQTI